MPIGAEMVYTGKDPTKEIYWSYRRGWRDGAGTRPLDEKFTKHKTREDLKAEYELGYTDGKAALDAAMGAACERIGHEPEILRVQEGSITREDLEDARLQVASWGHSKKVREIVAAGSMDGKTLGSTLVKVAELVEAGKVSAARQYVAEVSAENKARWEKVEVVPPDLNGRDAPSLEELREPTSVLDRYDSKSRSGDE
jgi:hypothetical protein